MLKVRLAAAVFVQRHLYQAELENAVDATRRTVKTSRNESGAKLDLTSFLPINILQPD